MRQKIVGLLSRKPISGITAIVALAAILAIILIAVGRPISHYATANTQNATLAGALIAAFVAMTGILINQIVTAYLARSDAQDNVLSTY